MDVTQLPFNRHVGITHDGGRLSIVFAPHLLNHLSTLHASALFSLAEAASGDALLQLFPEMSEKVAPLLRDAEISFRKPAQKSVYASAWIEEEAAKKLVDDLNNDKRSKVSVNVELYDSEEVQVCKASFVWVILPL